MRSGSMRTIVAGVLVGAACVGGSAEPLRAQDSTPGRRGIVEVGRTERPAGRRGFWAVFGLGGGSEQFSVDDGADEWSDPFTQPVVALRAGGTLGPHLRLGGEAQSWISEEAGTVQSLSSLLAVAQVYPFRRAGLHLKAGAGLARNGFEDEFGFDEGDTGFAAVLGVGWDVWVSRQFYLSPLVEVVGQRYERRDAFDYSERIVHVGLGVGFQPSGRR